MAIQSASVELLVQKGKFVPEVAVAIAEAFEMMLESAQLVTVPILDSRLGLARAESREEMAGLRAELREEIAALRAELREEMAHLRAELHVEIANLRAELLGEIAKLRSEMVRWVFTVMLGNVAITAGVTAVLNSLQR